MVYIAGCLTFTQLCYTHASGVKGQMCIASQLYCLCKAVLEYSMNVLLLPNVGESIIMINPLVTVFV